MSYAKQLREDQWDRLKNYLPGKIGDPGRSGEDNRRFIEGVLWVCRNGGSWRSIPKCYGKWNSLFQRFGRWSRNGVWKIILEVFSEEADMEWLLIDSTIIRAHQHAAGAKGGKKTSFRKKSRRSKH